MGHDFEDLCLSRTHPDRVLYPTLAPAALALVIEATQERHCVPCFSQRAKGSDKKQPNYNLE